MSSIRHVKWSKESLDFFNSADDDSLTLNAVISYGCLSQTGEGFREFVNTINSDNIKRKIKKLNIIDSSYLYRHTIPEFSKYSDKNVETDWYTKNKDSINSIECQAEVIPWVDKLDREEFSKWHEQIKKDFNGDDHGNGIILEFRDIVIRESAIASYKTGNDRLGCIDFILEECAYTCVFLENADLIYPSKMSEAIMYCMKKYNLGLNQLSYKISKAAQQLEKHVDIEERDLDKEITAFMREKVSNVNFFVIDKYGNHIYKNYALDKLIGNVNAKTLNPVTWRATSKVMQTREQIISEEKSDEGKYYLSLKAPLIIEDEVKGIIGLSVDITDRKQTEQLLLKNEIQKLKIKEQEEFNKFTSRVAHDIRSPLATLGMIAEACKNIPEKEHIALRSVITSIRDIASNLLNKYQEYEKECNSLEKDINQKILVNLVLYEIVGHKKYQYKYNNVKFSYNSDPSSNFTFIKCNHSRFSRMLSNLINNAVEAIPNSDKGIIDVNLWTENNNIKISTKDNGKGMPKELVNKILNDTPIGSDKKGGYGMGLEQIMNTLHLFNGDIEIESAENEGTTITLTFPIAQSPEWFLKDLEFQHGSIVVALDDDISIHHLWNKILEKHADDICVKCFEHGKDAIDFINSSEEKEKIFLLTDYELRNQELNGAEVIEETNMQKRSVIVTSMSNDKSILDFSEKTGVKILPKNLINHVNTSVVKEDSTSIAEMIILDDYEPFAELLADYFKAKGKKVDTYYSSSGLLNTIANYPKDTKIVMDNELKEQTTGIELAEKLNDAGYSNLYLLSGKQFNKNDVPNYLNTILKDDYNYLEKLYTIIF